jgi:diguanylate cyclase (GGDEF)-like protein
VNGHARRAAPPWARAARGLSKSETELAVLLTRKGLLTADEADELSAIADEPAGSAGVALEGAARFQRALARSLDRFPLLKSEAAEKKIQVLFEIQNLVQSATEPEECFRHLLAAIRRAIPADGATLFLQDRAEGRLRVAATAGRLTDLIPRVTFDQGMGLSAWVAREKRPVLLGHLRRNQLPYEGIVKSFLSVPLVVSRETIGVINLCHSEEEAFDKGDLRLLALIANQASGAIQRLLLFDRIREMAITDDLTALYNRRHFQEALDREIERSRRYGTPFSLVFLDVDEFKRYNDAHGHPAGDQALKELAQILRGWARSTDLLARFGGEEFVILLPCTERGQAAVAAERLRRKIEAHAFPRRKRLTVSVGVAAFPADGERGEELLALVDQALYRAKQAGRNRIVPAVQAAAA